MFFPSNPGNFWRVPKPMQLSVISWVVNDASVHFLLLKTDNIYVLRSYLVVWYRKTSDKKTNIKSQDSLRNKHTLKPFVTEEAVKKMDNAHLISPVTRNMKSYFIFNYMLKSHDLILHKVQMRTLRCVVRNISQRHKTELVPILYIWCCAAFELQHPSDHALTHHGCYTQQLYG